MYYNIIIARSLCRLHRRRVFLLIAINCWFTWFDLVFSKKKEEKSFNLRDYNIAHGQNWFYQRCTSHYLRYVYRVAISSRGAYHSLSTEINEPDVWTAAVAQSPLYSSTRVLLITCQKHVIRTLHAKQSRSASICTKLTLNRWHLHSAYCRWRMFKSNKGGILLLLFYGKRITQFWHILVVYYVISYVFFFLYILEKSIISFECT
jgi:hypothetical protein